MVVVVRQSCPWLTTPPTLFFYVSIILDVLHILNGMVGEGGLVYWVTNRIKIGAIGGGDPL